jgi:hypothetical protein
VRALRELARSPEVRHWPTRNELRLMAILDGRAPATYRLDPAVNPLARPDARGVGPDQGIGASPGLRTSWWTASSNRPGDASSPG